jgi:HAMP domain-containing protein
MRISKRLVLLLAIPLLGLLVVTGYGVVYGTSRALEASDLQERTQLALVTHALIDDLQAERNQLVSEAAADSRRRDRIRAAASDLQARLVDLDEGSSSRVDSLERRFRSIDRVATMDLSGRVALRHHSLAVEQLLDLSSELSNPRGAIDDGAASTMDYLARAKAASAEERDLLIFQTQGGTIDAIAFQQLTKLGAAQQSYTALAADSAADAAFTLRIERVGHAMNASDLVRRTTFDATGSGPDEEWLDGLVQRTDELQTLRDDASVVATAMVDDLARWSRALLGTAALASIAIVLVSALLLRRANRSIARPLQDLALQAEDVARQRLPEAVRAQQDHVGEELHLPALRATGAAEVHEVAAAFNDIQDTALRLAGEQAALRLNQSEAMTNLGRRNQTLLARQLDFISSLETRETDPVFLEHLFKLDHLASRMRRNAESLLILAGSETPRRRRTPAPVTEVVRAAMSEVEEFERVRIGHLRDATISGPAVIDLVHLLAELIENALGFSPPESTVEIDGRPLGQGYQFAIIDHGVGMSDLELLAANQRMSGNDELEGMPTRYLGQYVVAKLASKIGAMVHVQPSAGGRGVTATVNLPGAAMLGSPDRAAAAGPLPGSRKAREQGPVPFAPGAGVSELARVAVVEEAAPAEPLSPLSSFQDVEPIEPEPAPEPVTAEPVVAEPVVAERPDPFVPPPAPEAVPVQPEWAPAPADATAEPPAAPLGGGLTRRVPGASLAERSAGSFAAEDVAPVERSAEGVQSMLASFQAGRTRGRGQATDLPEERPEDPTDWRSTT